MDIARTRLALPWAFRSRRRHPGKKCGAHKIVLKIVNRSCRLRPGHGHSFFSSPFSSDFPCTHITPAASTHHAASTRGHAPHITHLSPQTTTPHASIHPDTHTHLSTPTSPFTPVRMGCNLCQTFGVPARQRMGSLLHVARQQRFFPPR